MRQIITLELLGLDLDLNLRGENEMKASLLLLLTCDFKKAKLSELVYIAYTHYSI